MQQIVFTDNIAQELSLAIEATSPDRVFVLTDRNTSRLCFPLIKCINGMANATEIQVEPGDTNKSLGTAAAVWRALCSGGATRHSLLINLGGGMITDLGGFAASAFKRGIAFVNIPTTLLAMVDASVGGKTGVNFEGLKNEIGFFAEANRVIIHAKFLTTLDHNNLLSGFAEMLKHSLLGSDKMWREHLLADFDSPDYNKIAVMVSQSIGVKGRIVEQDPHEKSLRKALNFGHTIGHALESLSMERGKPVLHGHAVAWGMVGELFLSSVKCGFPNYKLAQTVRFVRQNYSPIGFNCDDYEHLLGLMRHDKKNLDASIRFALLSDIARPCLDVEPNEAEIADALDYILMG